MTESSLDKIAICICWYDNPSIFKLLDSLPKQALKIVVDGRFEGNPAEKPLSNPHLRRKVSRYTNTVLIDAPDLTEAEKRQKYLTEMAKRGKKYCFIIDSDEFVIQANWDMFYKRCEILPDNTIHNVLFNDPARGGLCMFPRLWINPEHWKYHRKSHRTFYNTVTKQVTTSGTSDPKGSIGS